MFQPDMDGPKKKLQIMATDELHQEIKRLADESGLDQGRVIHLLLELLKIRLAVASKEELRKPTDQMPELTAYVLYSALDMKLLTRGDHSVLTTLAESDPPAASSMLINTMLRVMEKRFEYGDPSTEVAGE